MLHSVYYGLSIFSRGLSQGLQDGDFCTAELVTEWSFEEHQNAHFAMLELVFQRIILFSATSITIIFCF